MPVIKLTDRNVFTLEGPAEFRDALTPGLALRVHPSKGAKPGGRVFSVSFRIRGTAKKLRVGLGKAQDVSIVDVRARARRILAEAAAGRNIVEEERQQRAKAAAAASSVPTFASIADEWLELKIDRGRRKNGMPLSLSHRTQAHQLLRDYARPTWADRAISSIRRTDVHELLDDLERRGLVHTRNRLLTFLHMLFAYVLDREIVEADPTQPEIIE